MQVKKHKIKLKIGKYTSLRSKHTQNQAQNWELRDNVGQNTISAGNLKMECTLMAGKSCQQPNHLYALN